MKSNTHSSQSTALLYPASAPAMPKVPKSPGGQNQRHNPLAEEYAPTHPLKQKAAKQRRSTQQDQDAGDSYIDSKASRRILKIGQDLVDEDEAEHKSSQPNPAFSFDSRFISQEDAEEDRTYENDEEAWGDDDEEAVAEDVELDPNDQDIFNRFHPSSTADPSALLSRLSANGTTTSTTSTSAEPDQHGDGGGTNLADLILEKIAAHEAAIANGEDPVNPDRPRTPDAEDEEELPPKVVEVYTRVGDLLARHRSGPLPKPFKILPSLPYSQIPLLIAITRPENWTPHVHFLATRLFISAAPGVAQPFLTSILLPAVRDQIAETKKLHVHLYNALKKSLYKPAAFFKGILFPLLEDGTCTLREATIIGSVVARVSVPVLHSAAALLRLCDIAAEQFSTRRDGGGGGATNVFIRTLLEKKYALPYKVVDALVFHFLRFKALAGADAQADVDMETGEKRDVGMRLPVLWHQALLAFAQRYRNDITEDQREALLDLLQAVGHRQIGPEVRRELLEGRGRGVPAPGEGGMGELEGGDDTMVIVHLSSFLSIRTPCPNSLLDCRPDNVESYRLLSSFRVPYRLGVAAPQVQLVLADALTTVNPALLVRRATLVAQLVQQRPILVVLVHKVRSAAKLLVELLGRHMLLQVAIEDDLLVGVGIDEGTNELEESVDEPGQLGHAGAAEALGVVALQDGHGLAGLSHGGAAAAGGALEVNEDGAGVLAGRHEVDGALEHEDEVLDLALALLCVLPPGRHVQAGAAGVVVAEDVLLACLALDRDGVGGYGGDVVLAAPGEGREETLGSFDGGPIGGTEVAQQALAGQEHALIVGELQRARAEGLEILAPEMLRRPWCRLWVCCFHWSLRQRWTQFGQQRQTSRSMRGPPSGGLPCWPPWLLGGGVFEVRPRAQRLVQGRNSEVGDAPSESPIAHCSFPLPSARSSCLIRFLGRPTQFQCSQWRTCAGLASALDPDRLRRVADTPHASSVHFASTCAIPVPRFCLFCWLGLTYQEHAPTKTHNDARTPTMADVDTELAERFPGLPQDVMGELASISRLHSLAPQELFYKWESYNIKMGGDNVALDLQTTRDFKKDIQDALERETRGKMHGRATDRKPVGATPRNAKVGSDLFDGMDGVVATPRVPMAGVNGNSQKRRSNFNTPASKATKAHAGSSPADAKTLSALKDSIAPFSSRTNAGQVEMSLNSHIEAPKLPLAPSAEPRIKLRANVELKKFAYRNMAMKLSEVSEVLDDRIDTFMDVVKEHHKLEDTAFGNPTHQSTSEIVAVGRIAGDSQEGKLTPSSVVLEASRRMGAGVRVPLRLDALQAYDFFPGKIVALRGNNPKGDYFAVSEILEIPMQYSAAPLIQDFDATAARLGDGEQTLNVLVASGPYTADSNLDFEPLQAICDKAAESSADALILLGPFLDVEHPLLASGDIPPLPESLKVHPDTATLVDVFRGLISLPLQRLVQAVPSITVLMVPSVRDAINKHVSFPQDRMNRKLLGLPKECSIVTNPVTISLNEAIFTISSQDILYELKRQECVKQAPGQQGSDTLARMSKHLLEQRHVFPVFPPISRDRLPKPTAIIAPPDEDAADNNGAIGAVFDVSYLGLGEIPDVRPDVLITPSSLSPFTKVVDSVVVINPGPLSKRRAPGTFAQMFIQPRLITDAERSAGEPVGTKMFERARVDVVRI
ncbi:hypothetical protein FH972_024665 [Carpinus fangiana]|uniref:DNA polymerase alpha subunit B n=1 Tax=Carpinus fangiana TaxID=176857 RepID=A0A5N6KZC1_9ROSI|nr:hypothetical protein FH972_024665 [Carpinus fangiana]